MRLWCYICFEFFSVFFLSLFYFFFPFHSLCIFLFARSSPNVAVGIFGLRCVEFDPQARWTSIRLSLNCMGDIGSNRHRSNYCFCIQNAWLRLEINVWPIIGNAGSLSDETWNAYKSVPCIVVLIEVYACWMSHRRQTCIYCNRIVFVTDGIILHIHVITWVMLRTPKIVLPCHLLSAHVHIQFYILSSILCVSIFFLFCLLSVYFSQPIMHAVIKSNKRLWWKMKWRLALPNIKKQVCHRMEYV